MERTHACNIQIALVDPLLHPRCGGEGTVYQVSHSKPGSTCERGGGWEIDCCREWKEHCTWKSINANSKNSRTVHFVGLKQKQEKVGTTFSRLKVLRTCLTSISIGCNSHATQIDKVWALFSTDSRIWRRFVKIEDDPGMARKNASSSQEWQRQKPGAGVLWET